MIGKTAQSINNKVSFIMKIALNIMLGLSIAGLVIKTLFINKQNNAEQIADMLLKSAVYVVAISPIVVMISLLIFYIFQKKREGILLSLGLLLAISLAITISIVHKLQ